MASEAVAPRTTASWAPVGEHRHAIRAGVVWFLVAYTALSAATIVVGLVLTHGPLSVESWDKHASVWLFNHRTAFMDGVSHWGTFLANTMGVVVVAIVVTVWTIVRR